MKKVRVYLIWMYFLLGSTLSATAAPMVMLENTQIGEGKTSFLRLRLLSGEEPYCGSSAKMILPQGFRVIGVSGGDHRATFTVYY